MSRVGPRKCLCKKLCVAVVFASTEASIVITRDDSIDVDGLNHPCYSVLIYGSRIGVISCFDFGAFSPATPPRPDLTAFASLTIDHRPIQA